MSYSSPVLTKSDHVEDWVHDFDLFDPGYVRDPYAVWSGVRGCPVLTSERWGGSHLIIGYEAVMEAAANTGALTSTPGTSAAPTLDDHRDPNRPRSIINTDPPDHAPVRRMILPSFAGRRGWIRAGHSRPLRAAYDHDLCPRSRRPD